MRNLTAVVLVLTLCAGISLGQEADTSNPAEETLQVQETAPAVTTTPVKITLPKWVIGFTANNLEFKSWPGTVTLQRRIGKCNYLSLGVSGSNQQSGPDENTDEYETYSGTDTVISKNQSRSWQININPEVSRLIVQKHGWLLSLGLEAGFGFYKNSHSYESKHSLYPYDYRSAGSVAKNYSYSLSFPASLEKTIKIKGQRMSFGIRSHLVQATSSVGTYDSWYVYSSATTGYYSDGDHNKSTMPWNASFKNPFQGNVQVQLKYWF